MTKPISFGQFELNLGTEAGGQASQRRPFRLLVMGDFSGRHNRDVTADRDKLAGQRTYSIDPDTYEEVLARLNVALQLELPGSGEARVELSFSELDHFHPDHIFTEAEVFAELRALRRRLLNPKTFAEAAAEMSAPAPEAQPPATVEPTEPDDEPSSAGLLDALVDETQARGPQRDDNRRHGRWHQLVRSIVEPYVIPAADPRQADLVASVDEATGEAMRRILHHPDFQALEAAWRGLDFLRRRLVVEQDLQLHLFDLSRDELVADLLANEHLEQTALYKLLVERTVGTAGGQAWSAVVVDHRFGSAAEDAQVLGRLAKLARAAGAAVLAGACPTLVGCTSLAETPDPDDWNDVADSDASETWQALQELPEAAHVGLALPRILLRLPYGPRTVPIDSFQFDELDAQSPHESYLWGNAAYACGLVLAQAYEQRGWDFRPGQVNTIEGLPLHIFRRDGEAEHKPCAEVLLSDRAAERIHNAGLIALQSIRDRDAVQLMRIRSLSNGSPALAGGWTG